MGYINTDGKLISLYDYSMMKEFKEGMSEFQEVWELNEDDEYSRTGEFGIDEE